MLTPNTKFSVFELMNEILFDTFSKLLFGEDVNERIKDFKRWNPVTKTAELSSFSKNFKPLMKDLVYVRVSNPFY